MQQCLLANCTTIEHQQCRRLGLQQLHTATGGHPADGLMMTADVVGTACQTTVRGLQPGGMVPCRSVSDRPARLSPACIGLQNTLGWLSTSGNTGWHRYVYVPAGPVILQF